MVKHGSGDGALRFDQLESPWKRHVCGENVNIDYFGLDHLWRQLAGEQGQRVSLALVAGARQMWGAHPPIYVAVLELANPIVRHCLEVRCDMATPPELVPRAQIKPGALMALCVNGSVRRLMTLSGFGFECVDAKCPPEKLGIPAEWFGEPV